MIYQTATITYGKSGNNVITMRDLFYKRDHLLKSVNPISSVKF